MNKIQKLLKELNPEFIELYPAILSNIEKLNSRNMGTIQKGFCEDQTVLITYADQFKKKGESNFAALDEFLQVDLENCISHVHILPFYPWTSDDGFSPVNYHEVCSDYGDWVDVEKIKAKKMFDCVYNHVSSKNNFFQAALNGDKSCEKMLHVYSEEEFNTPEFQENIPLVVRPRLSPLFTPYKFKEGTKYVWTTFSDDQIDTNISNSRMVKYIIETLFLYIEKGAKFFRVDAVPFMWKELGTNCSHLEKTHKFVQLLRAITDAVNDSLLIITESNVPHQENITYWGNGRNEAHVIYNFSLAPLVLHAMTFGSNKYINKWGKEVFDIDSETTYLNFTSTHDGVGLRGLEGIVPDDEIDTLCSIVESKGGRVSKKRSRDGSEKPYELNITWASALEDNALLEEVYLSKLVNSHAIVMFLPGITAHYVHNFLGTKNWEEGFEESGIPRRLNRRKFDYPLEYNKFSQKVKDRLVNLVKFKNERACFSASEPVHFIDKNESVLIFERGSEDQRSTIFFNLTSKEQTVDQVILSPYELRIIEREVFSK